MDIKNILETFGFYGEIFSPRQKEIFTFPISLFLFILTNCYVDQCDRDRLPFIMSQLYFLLKS